MVPNRTDSGEDVEEFEEGTPNAGMAQTGTEKKKTLY
jgi:hypothetical protein